jgi:biopolymer transport protein ExbD
MKISLDDDSSGDEIPMAPLIDCVFLLLIFFLVATTLKKTEPEIPIELPVSAAALERPRPDDLLVLAIDASGRAYVRGEPVTTARLLELVRAAAAEDPERRVRIDADRATRYEDVLQLIELCQFEGLRHVGLHTRAEKR